MDHWQLSPTHCLCVSSNWFCLLGDNSFFRQALSLIWLLILLDLHGREFHCTGKSGFKLSVILRPQLLRVKGNRNESLIFYLIQNVFTIFMCLLKCFSLKPTSLLYLGWSCTSSCLCFKTALYIVAFTYLALPCSIISLLCFLLIYITLLAMWK